MTPELDTSYQLGVAGEQEQQRFIYSPENPPFLQEEWKILEPFRHPIYPFLYVVKNKKDIRSVSQMFVSRNFGLEVGFGNEPTRIFHIDKRIPWILAEPNKEKFKNFKDFISDYWSDLDISLLDIKQPIVAVNDFVTFPFQKTADVLVYRNLDYRDMNMVPYNQLREGQRVVFIVDPVHNFEMPRYLRYLQSSQRKYDKTLLLPRDKSLPSLTYTHPFDINFDTDTYVLDIIKA